MKKLLLGIIPVIMVVAGCAGNPSPVLVSENSTANSGLITLDQALNEAASRIDERIPAESKIAPLNFNSPHDKFSDYVLEELTANLVDSRKLTVVDRREIDLIRNEVDFQYSGEVGDDSMQQIGRMLGAQSIISGNFTDMGGFIRIMIRVLNVQNASVEVQYRANIVSDTVTAALLTGGRKNVAAAVTRQTSSSTQAAQTPTAPVVQTQTPAIPVQRSFPLVGTWKLTGRSINIGVNWGGELVIEEVNRERFSGYLDWYRSGITYSGREYFRGTYDSKDRLLVLEGYRLVNPIGIGLGKYQAFLSRTGLDFISGTWFGGGGNVVSGSWEAQWIE